MYIYHSTENNKLPVIPVGKWDNHPILFSRGIEKYKWGKLQPAQRDQQPTNINTTFGEFIEDCFVHAKTEVENKDSIDANFFCQFAPGSATKENTNITVRSTVTLDFDEAGFDVNAALGILRRNNWAFIAYTTHSTDNKNTYVDYSEGVYWEEKEGVKRPLKYGNHTRLKVVLPTHQTYTLDQWGHKGTEGSNDPWNQLPEYFRSIGFVNGLKVDKSSYNIGQYQAAPAINPEVGYVNLWLNNGPETELFDIPAALATLPTITPSSKAAKGAASAQTNGQATPVADDEDAGTEEASDEGDSATIKALLLQAKDPAFVGKVIVRLNMKSWLKCHYQHGTYFDWGTKTIQPESNKTSAAAFAWAIRFIGGKLSDFQNFMAAHGNSSVTDTRIWNETKSGKSTPNALFAVFDSSDYTALGISGKQYPITDYLQEREDEEYNKWELVYPTPGTQYIDTNTVPKYRGGKRDIVDYAGLSAGMGSGKNYIMHKYKPGSTLLLGPTLAIVLQAGSHNIAGVDHVLTYDAGAAGLDKGNYSRCIWDEGHNAGLIPYRHGAIASLDKITNARPKQLLVQSATVDYSAHVMMAALYGATNPVFVKFIQPTTSNKYYKRAIIKKGVSRTKAILFEINNAVAAGRKVYVVNDSKKDNRTITEALKFMGVNAAAIDADVIGAKSCPIANDFISASNDFSFDKHGLKVVLSTRLGCEGINIKDTGAEATVIIVGELEPEFVRQTYGRFRNADTVYGVHISNGGAYRKTIVDEYKKKRELEIASRRSDIIGYRADCATRGITMSQQNFMNYFIKRGIEGNVLTELARDGWYFDTVTNEPQEYWFAQMVLRSEIEKIKFYQSLEHQRVYMEVAGFEVEDVCFISPDDITDEIQSALDAGAVSAAASRAASEAKLIASLDKIIEIALEEDDFDDALTKGIKNEFGNTSTYYKLIEALHILSGMISISNAEKFDTLRKVIIGKIDNDDLRAEVLMGLSSIRDELLSIWPIGTKVKSDDLDMAPDIVLQMQYDRCKANGMTDIEIIILMGRSNSIWHGEKITIGSTCSVKELNYIPKWLKNNNLIELGKRKQKRNKITREATYEYPVIG